MSLRTLIKELASYPGYSYMGFDECIENITNHLEEFYGEEYATQFRRFDFRVPTEFIEVRNRAVDFLNTITKQTSLSRDASKSSNFIQSFAHKSLLGAFESRDTPELFNDAIENIMQTVADRVADMAKRRGLKMDKSGNDLMTTTFSADAPIIDLVYPDNISAQTAKDIRRGFMFLFSGGMLALRNAATHGKSITRDRREVVQILMFASLLMNELDKVEMRDKQLEGGE